METLTVQVEPATRGAALTSLARPEPQTGATMLDGDAERAAAQIVAMLSERGVLVS